MLREKGKGLIGKRGEGGFRQNCVNSLLKFIQNRNCRVQEILKLS